MRTITLVLDDEDISHYQLKQDIIEFDTLKEKIILDIGKNALKKAVVIAKNTNLDKLTLKDINNEINNVRQ